MKRRKNKCYSSLLSQNSFKSRHYKENTQNNYLTEKTPIISPHIIITKNDGKTTEVV